MTILLLLVLGQHFENHWYNGTQRTYDKVAGRKFGATQGAKKHVKNHIYYAMEFGTEGF